MTTDQQTAVFSPGVSPDAQVDPSARIDPSAHVGAGCVLGPDVIVGPGCSVGAGTRLHARSMLVRNTVLGTGNEVHPYAVLGGDPQDKSYSDEHPGHLFVGNDNIFREGCTLSRGTAGDEPTRIGHRNYFMAQAHAAHNVQIGSDNVFPNTTMIAGHVHIGDRCVFSGGVSIHQFVLIGDGVMIRGLVPVGMHVPPYVMVVGPNRIGGLNVIGMRRSGVGDTERAEVKRVHQAVFRDRQATPIVEVLDRLEADGPLGAAASHMIAFIRNALAQTGRRAKGICPGRSKATDAFK